MSAMYVQNRSRCTAPSRILVRPLPYVSSAMPNVSTRSTASTASRPCTTVRPVIIAIARTAGVVGVVLARGEPGRRVDGRRGWLGGGAPTGARGSGGGGRERKRVGGGKRGEV